MLTFGLIGTGNFGSKIQSKITTLGDLLWTANSSSDYNEKVENGERYIVGVNKFVSNDYDNIDIPILKISKKVEQNQIKRLNDMKKKRNNSNVKIKLKSIENACQTKDNLVPLIIDAALEYATLGEIVSSMKSHFGDWQEKSII